MGHAIFYTHQTSGACADMCACNCMHQMEKTGRVGRSSILQLGYKIGQFIYVIYTIQIYHLLDPPFYYNNAVTEAQMHNIQLKIELFFIKCNLFSRSDTIDNQCG